MPCHDLNSGVSAPARAAPCNVLTSNNLSLFKQPHDPVSPLFKLETEVVVSFPQSHLQFQRDFPFLFLPAGPSTRSL